MQLNTMFSVVWPCAIPCIAPVHMNQYPGPSAQHATIDGQQFGTAMISPPMHSPLNVSKIHSIYIRIHK